MYLFGPCPLNTHAGSCFSPRAHFWDKPIFLTNINSLFLFLFVTCLIFISVAPTFYARQTFLWEHIFDLHVICLRFAIVFDVSEFKILEYL